MPFKTIDDVEREKHNESREKVKKEVTEDINEVFGNLFKKPKKPKKNFIDHSIDVFKILGIIILGLIIINLVLGNVWLLRFFIKSLFGIG